LLDLVLVGGSVIDGLGGPARSEDIGIVDGRIVALDHLATEPAIARIDARGLTTIPGIVDIHSHSDLTLISDGSARSKVMQGVTTEIVGNCGLGPFPLDPRSAAQARLAISIIDLDEGVKFDWTDLEGYRRAVKESGPAINLAALVGHVPLRIAAAPDAAGPLDNNQLGRLLTGLETALDSGAVGFSTGLMYPPAMSADRAELIAIGEVVAAHDRLFAMHARNYSTHLLAAVDEALDIARVTGCRLQFSHLAVAGRNNWGSVAVALERIDDALADGIDVGVDIYPYLAGSANLSQLLPEWSQIGGADEIVRRLGRTADRKRIIAEWPELMVHRWDEIVVSFVDGDLESVLGLTVQQIAERWSIPPSEAALNVIRDSHNRAMMVAYGRSEGDLMAVLRHPAASVGSDGLSLNPDGPTGAGIPHPRSYGCYPRLIGRMVREGAISLEKAVAMSTSIPAERVGLTGRGSIQVGSIADLAVIDADTYLDEATYSDPARFAIGVSHVVVDGRRVVVDGVQDLSVRAGAFLDAEQ